MKLIASASIQIQKPIGVVFESIVDPAKMSNYFIAESSGRMEAGSDLTWKFPEFPDTFPITKISIEVDRSVSFVWDKETIVSILLTPQNDGSTLVKVKEDGKTLSEENLKWLVGNTEGWANFLACMKAYLEYNVQLRKGAFDFMKAK